LNPLTKKKKPFLWEIHESTSGLDVDKMDFLLRDEHYCATRGVRFDYERIIGRSFICNGYLGFYAGEVLPICGFFESKLFSDMKIYGHINGTAVEMMISDILREASEKYNLSYIFKQENEWLEKFCLLDDTILNEIARSKSLLMNRIIKRDFYPLIGQVTVKEEDVTIVCDKLRNTFSPEKFKIIKQEFHYGLKDTNPISKIYFGNPKQVKRKMNVKGTLVTRTQQTVVISIYGIDSKQNPSISLFKKDFWDTIKSLNVQVQGYE